MASVNASARHAGQRDEPLLAIHLEHRVARTQAGADPAADLAPQIAQMFERQAVEGGVGLGIERDHPHTGTLFVALGDSGRNLGQRGKKTGRSKGVHGQAR